MTNQFDTAHELHVACEGPGKCDDPRTSVNKREDRNETPGLDHPAPAVRGGLAPADGPTRKALTTSTVAGYPTARNPSLNPVDLRRGDALEVMRALPDASIDAVVTDPPYSSGGRRENARSIRTSMVRTVENDDWIAGDSMSTPGFVWTLRQVAIEARRVLKPGGSLLSFIDWRMYPNLTAAIESADLRQHPTLVWDKTQFGMGAIFRNQHEWIAHFTVGSAAPPRRRDVPNVLACQPVRDGDHPTQKPVPLMRQLVSVVCPKGGTVLDPFMGSGSTGVAAVLEGCRFVGVEMTEHYYRVAETRIRTAMQGYREHPSQMVLGVDDEQRIPSSGGAA